MEMLKFELGWCFEWWSFMRCPCEAWDSGSSVTSLGCPPSSTPLRHTSTSIWGARSRPLASAPPRAPSYDRKDTETSTPLPLGNLPRKGAILLFCIEFWCRLGRTLRSICLCKNIPMLIRSTSGHNSTEVIGRRPRRCGQVPPRGHARAACAAKRG